ncbi:MAG: hypothetical protein Q9222_007904, partial [Ikaeria aurantiellina]
MDYDTGFNKSGQVIREIVIEDVLLKKCGYKARNILFFGFGQGAMAALASALTLKAELGGIVSIGGPLPSSLSSAADSGKKKNQTPIIVLGGSTSTLITQSGLTDLRRAFQTVEYTKWPKAGDGMPRQREEMLPIMKFFARRLQSRSGVPDDDAVE